MDRRRESLLTVDEACKILRVSRWTLGRWIEAGKLSARKVGHRVLVPADEIERLLDQSKVVVRGLPTPPLAGYSE